MIKASIEIPSYLNHQMAHDELKDYVMSQLVNQLVSYFSKNISKNMTVSKAYDSTTDSSIYTGTVTLNSLTTSSISASTISGYNGTTSPSYSQINLRVVEYTKNGKVTRVELQKYNEFDDSWSKIPRIQVEE